MTTPQTVNICVKHTDHKLYNFVIEPTRTTVCQLKELLAMRSETPQDTIRFLFGGKFLEDEHTLAHYDVENCATIHSVGGIPGGAGIIPVGAERPKPPPNKPGL